jgi:hypothetical protein
MKEKESRADRYKRVKEIYNYRCANYEDPRCNCKKQLTMHHIIFQCEGGLSLKENLIPLGVGCQILVHSMAREKDKV